MTTDKEYLTIQETAVLLGLSETTIRRLIRARSLRAFRAGVRRLMLRREDVLAMLKEVGADVQPTESTE